MRRLPVLLAILLLTPASAAVAGAPCGGDAHHVETLTVSLPAAPAKVRAGTTVTVPVTVARPLGPAEDVLVHLRLHPAAAPHQVAYDSASTSSTGRAVLQAEVPRHLRGPLQLTVEASRHVAGTHCLGTVEEHGTAGGGWGRAVR